LLIQNSDPILAQKVRYYDDRCLAPVFEGQSADYPETPHLQIIKSVPVSEVVNPKTTAQSEGKPDDALRAEEEISPEDFARMQGAQAQLLERIKVAKKKVVNSL
jgi:type IV secretion system protein VirD4